MTETAAATTFTMPGDPIEHLVGTVGRPKLGGVAGDPELDDGELGGGLSEYRAVDATGALLPAGQEGELVTRGPIITPGYFDKPRETAEARLPGGWLRSGDLGVVREDGYLVLTGRSKELYKCGGELVMPGEVEDRLTRRPDVAQAHVVGVPDERMGEVGCAWIVPAEGSAPDADALVGYCSDELARFKVPKYVLFTTADRLPLTASGTVQKFRLAQRATEQLGLPEQV
jgi:fatty-acyl-CoA synthase